MTKGPWVLTMDSAHWVVDDGIRRDVTEALKNEGFIVAHARHRLAPAIGTECNGRQPGTCGGIPGQKSSGMFPEQNNDVEMAVAAALKDPRCDGRVEVIGGSGGAYLATWLQAKGLVAAAVAFSPATNLIDIVAGGGIPAKKAQNFCAPQNYQDASPVFHETTKSAPIYVASFQNDQMPASQYDDIVAKLIEIGIKNTHVLIPGSGHSWSAWTSQSSAAVKFLKDNLPPVATPTPTPTPSATPKPSLTPTATPSPTSTPQASTFSPGVYYLCAMDQDIAKEPGLTNPNIVGVRLRDTARVNVKNGSIDFTAIDKQISDAKSHGKAVGLSFAFGVNAAPSDYFLAPFVSLDADDKYAQPPFSGKVPVPWSSEWQAFLRGYINQLGAHLDGKLSYLAVTGYQLNVENELGDSQAEFDRWTARAKADGYPDASAALVAAYKAILPMWREAFPTTAFHFTAHNPLAKFEHTALPEMKAFTLTMNNAGWGTSFLKAVAPPYEAPRANPYPTVYQSVSSSQDSRFYVVWPQPSPAPPRLVQDLVSGGGLPKGAQVVEIYKSDCNAPDNRDALADLNDALKANR